MTSQPEKQIIAIHLLPRKPLTSYAILKKSYESLWRKRDH